MSWVERRVVASFVHFGDYTIAITQRRFTTEYPSSYPPRAISLSNPPPHTKPALRTQGGSHPRVWPPTATGPCRPMASTRGLGKRMSAPRDATQCITDDSNDWIKAYHRIPREQRREDHRKGRMKGATGQAELTQPLASAQVELMRPSELAAACDSFTVRCLEEARAGAARHASAQDGCHVLFHGYAPQTSLSSRRLSCIMSRLCSPDISQP